jgi:hypothetical protein
LHLPAGTATAGTAPLEFTVGTNLSSPVGGTVEYDGYAAYLTVNSPSVVRKTLGTFVSAPASSTSPGNPGDFSADANYIYHCVSTNVWVRAAIVGGW